MTLTSGEGGTPWPNVDGHRPAGVGAESRESVGAALMLLEQAEGADREALVERLVQAHMSGLLAEALVEKARQGAARKP